MLINYPWMITIGEDSWMHIMKITKKMTDDVYVNIHAEKPYQLVPCAMPCSQLPLYDQKLKTLNIDLHVDNGMML